MIDIDPKLGIRALVPQFNSLYPPGTRVWYRRSVVKIAGEYGQKGGEFVRSRVLIEYEGTGKQDFVYICRLKPFLGEGLLGEGLFKIANLVFFPTKEGPIYGQILGGSNGKFMVVTAETQTQERVLLGIESLKKLGICEMIPYSDIPAAAPIAPPSAMAAADGLLALSGRPAARPLKRKPSSDASCDQPKRVAPEPSPTQSPKFQWPLATSASGAEGNGPLNAIFRTYKLLDKPPINFWSQEVRLYCEGLASTEGLPANLACVNTGLASVGRGIFLKPNAKPIEPGTFISFYAGELVRERNDSENSYIFNFVNADELMPEDQNKLRRKGLCIDAARSGNFSRFFNHAEEEDANVKPFLVRVNNGPPGSLLWQIAFLASRQIAPGEQLMFNYGVLYWKPKDIEPIRMTPASHTLVQDRDTSDYKVICRKAGDCPCLEQ